LPDGTRQTPTRDYAPGGQYYGKDTGPRANDLPGYRPQTGYQNSPARQQGTFDPATNTYRPAAGSAQPPQQRGPQADPDKPGRQLQQPQQTQPQPNQPRPAPTQQELERKPGQYFGTREQKAEQYKKDYEDYKLQDRAYRQYPADPDKQARALERLRSDAAKTTQHQEDLRYKETPQQKDERERYKQGEQNKRSQNSLDALKYRTDMSQLGNLVREREGNAFKQLLADQTRWAKDNPGKPYQFKPEEDALIARMRETATKNDLYEQLRPRIGNNPGTTAPVEVTKPTARDGAADLETYRGDATPKGWDIPKGWTWGRSKSTGKWEARPSQPSQ
jgi:hypothetical protein